jgi:uncharacterized membrane protein
MRALRKFARDRRGVMSIMTAISAMVLLGFTAGAVDFGSVYLKSRQLQGAADLAAMSAANDLGNAQAAANATVAANNLSSAAAAVQTGVYTPNETTAMSQRFVAGGSSPNAARVTVSSAAPLYFASLFLRRSSLPISRTATAARAELASFSIGTRLASLNGGVANALLSALTGSTVNLSVMDYNSLANAQIDLFQYSNALKSRANITAASFNDTLASSVTTGQALAAIGDVLSSNGANSAIQPIQTIARAANGTSVTVGQLMNLGPYGNQDYINASGGSGVSVSALDLASAILQLAQGGHQVQLNLNLGVPGVASTSAWLAIGQRPANSPWIAITDANTVIVTTAQARLYIDTKVAPASALSGVASIDVPVIVELASAQAKLSSITCGTTSAGNSVSLSVAPSVGEVALGQINTSDLGDFNDTLAVSPAQIVNALLLKVTGSAQVNVGGNDWQTVSFDGADIAAGTIKTVQTTNIASETFSSLLGNLNLNVQLLGLNLGLGQSAVTATVQNTLKTVATPLDGAINNLTGLLGVGLGEADVRINGVRCNDVALVQ